MNILAIESSCDETAAAIVRDGQQILSNIVNSQISLHQLYGGVVPEVAARSHIEAILPVIDQAFIESNLSWQDIDAIAVTHTPGLLGSLLVGTLTARTLAVLRQKPLFAIHHLKSHIYANWLDLSASQPQPRFPLLALVISGGHTQIIYMQHHNDFHIIGSTRDDAVGEVFDKVAKMLGLSYPGGPSIAKAAQQGDAQRFKLPIPQVDQLDFSFSGLKTAVLRAIQKELKLDISTPSYILKDQLSQQQVNDFAASFQNTATDILVRKLLKAYHDYQDAPDENSRPNSLLIAGGVSANAELRRKIHANFDQKLDIFIPKPQFSTDNAAMVAAAAYYSIKAGQAPSDPYTLDIAPRSIIY